MVGLTFHFPNGPNITKEIIRKARAVGGICRYAMQRIEACVLEYVYELLAGIRWLANRWQCYIRCSNSRHIGAILGTELSLSQSIMEKDLTAPIDR